MTSGQLQTIVDARLTLIGVVLGYDGESFEPIEISGQQIVEMARELLRLVASGRAEEKRMV